MKSTLNGVSPLAGVGRFCAPRNRRASWSSSAASRTNTSIVKLSLGFESIDPDTVSVLPTRVACAITGLLRRSFGPVSASSAAPPSFGVGPSPPRSIASPPFERKTFSVIRFRRPLSTTTPEPVNGGSSTRVNPIMFREIRLALLVPDRMDAGPVVAEVEHARRVRADAVADDAVGARAADSDADTALAEPVGAGDHVACVGQADLVVRRRR